MAHIRFFPVDVSYKVKEGKAAVYLYGRTDDGKQVCVSDSTFRPYFYVIPKKGAKISERLAAVTAEAKGIKYSVTGIEEAKKKYMGKPVDALRVYVNIPKGVPLIRDQIKGWEEIEIITEYDIKFARRYLIDKKITPMTMVQAEGEPSAERARVPVISASHIEQFSDDTLKEPKILAIDIETYNPNGRQMDPENNPIVMIGLYGERYSKVLTWKTFRTEEKYIEFVKSEMDMLNRLKDIIENYKPDIITGYYSDGFDFPYIQKRADKYKIRLDIGLDYSELDISGRVSIESRITGIVHLDILNFVRKTFGRTMQTDEYTLNAVAGEILGEKKVDIAVDRLAEVWDSHPEQIADYCKYNLQDARLTYGITQKLIPNLIELVKIVGIPIYDVNRMGFSQLVEWYLLRQAPNFNEIAPERPHYNEVSRRRRQTYTGGFVYEPKPGLYKDITVLDFRSLYPTIIASHNISPGTLNCGCCEGKETAPGEKYWFCTKKKGFIPTIIEDLITRRMRVKEIMGKNKAKDPMLSAREQSLKLLANSFYGYLGFFNARWYSLESAKSVTAWARHYIKDSMKKAIEEGFNVIYGDTDSVFITLDGRKKEDAVKFVEKVNSKLPGVMELEYEGYYPSGIFVSAKVSEAGAKKKYALLAEDGSVEIKGFETVRRDWSAIAKKVQREILDIILKKNEPEKAVKYVRKVVKDLRDHKIPVEDVIMSTQLQKEIGDYESLGPHVAAAQLMEKKGIKVSPGMIIRFVIAKGKGKIRDKVKLVDDTAQEDYDPEYYVNNQIIPAVERILSVLGYKESDITDHGQSKLGSFI